MTTFSFYVTISSDRHIDPQDILEAFEGKKRIRLDEDVVVVVRYSRPDDMVYSNPDAIHASSNDMEALLDAST